MILIIDSGATNSTWKIVDSSEKSIIIKSRGFNLSTSDIEDFVIPNKAKPYKSVEMIFLFSAGTDDGQVWTGIKKILSTEFTNCSFYYLGSDLNSAGIALSFQNKSIINILGTGSNSCLFDSTNISEKINNLGFILGDEGSGFQMGKMILNDYFYNMMPSNIHKQFESKFKISREELIRVVYNSDAKPNKYIASFCAFLSMCESDYRDKIARTALESFVQRLALQFDESRHLVHHFSGSISWHFQDILKELYSKYTLKIGNIIQNPIDSLTYSKLIQIQTNINK